MKKSKQILTYEVPKPSSLIGPMPSYCKNLTWEAFKEANEMIRNDFENSGISPFEDFMNGILLNCILKPGTFLNPPFSGKLMVIKPYHDDDYNHLQDYLPQVRKYTKWFFLQNHKYNYDFVNRIRKAVPSSSRLWIAPHSLWAFNGKYAKDVFGILEHTHQGCIGLGPKGLFYVPVQNQGA